MYHYMKRCVLVLDRISLNPFVPSSYSLSSLPSLLLLQKKREREKEREREKYRSIGKWMKKVVGVWKSEKSAWYLRVE